MSAIKVLYKDGAVSVRESILEDIVFLRNNLRKEDIAEVWAASHHNPEQALLEAYIFSILRHTLTLNNEPIAMFGLIPDSLLSDEANLWFLGSEKISKCPKSFLKACRVFIDSMLQMFPKLYNYVDARYEKSIRWLKWCGADVYGPQSFGVEKMPFHYLVFKRGE